MGNENEMENFKVLEYPEDFLVVTFDPRDKEYFFFSDAVYILLESLDYELYFIIIKKDYEKFQKENRAEANLIFRSLLDSSFLRINSEFYFVPFDNFNIPLVKIKECYLMGYDYEEDVTKEIKKFAQWYPKKIDLFYLLKPDFEEGYSLSPKHTFYSNSLNKKFSFKL